MKVRQGELVGKCYRIVSKLGSGGFSKTYLAVDIRRFNQQVVVKQLEIQQEKILEVAKSYFKKEAEALKKLGETHDRIPRLIAYFEEDGELYLVQEFVEGHDLTEEFQIDETVEKKDKVALINEEKLIEIFIEILEILEFVHQNNVIHRDIKPSNIRRRKKDEKIVLIDFGAVKETALLNKKGMGKQEQTIAIGTRGYMAPEQSAGFPKPCSDIYSLGMIAVHSLTGMHPLRICSDFHRLKIEKVWHDLVGGTERTDKKKAPTISPYLLEVLDKMIAYEFTERYQSAAEVIEDLRQIKENANKSQIPTNFLPNLNKINRRKQKSKIKLAAIGTGIGLSLIALVFLFFPTETVNLNPLASRSHFCSKVEASDRLSCGEEFLLSSFIKQSKKAELFNAYQDNDYQEVLNVLLEVWENSEDKDPETLIYLQNILLQLQEQEYYTIAVVVPAGESEFNTKEGKDLAREVLRGVAQAQLEVNLGLLDISQIQERLPNLGLLPQKAIDGKGLKIVIADDASSPKQSNQIAKKLVKQPDLIGVIGHYSSQSTLAAVDIYNEPDNYLSSRYTPLPLISPGTATEELTFNPREVFSRTVPRVEYHARNLVDYLIEAKKKTKIAVFYNSQSDFSRSFFQEFQQEFRDKEPNAFLLEFDDLHQLDSEEKLKTIIEQVKNLEIEALVIFPDSYISNAVNNSLKIITANSQLENPRDILGGWTLHNPKTLQLGQEILEPLLENNKLILFVPWHRLSSPDAEFPYTAEKLWDVAIDTSPMALAYDATRAFILALGKQENPTRISVQKILRSGQEIGKGATGNLKFNSENGDRLNPSGVFIHVVTCNNPRYSINNFAFVPLEFETCQ